MNQIRPWLYIGKYRETLDSRLEAFASVQQAHPDAMPHMALWNSLCQYYEKPIPWIEIA
jgi:hypothetical protein